MVRKRDLEIVRKFKKKLTKKIPIKKIILFGSRATGKTHRWSDFDLIVVSDEFKGKKSFERGIGFHNDWGYDYPADFLCFTPEEFNRLKKRPTIVKNAVEEGIEV